MFLQLIEKRRSIRRYKPDAIEPGTIAHLREAALRAPSSRGLNPWEFVFVTDRSLLKTLAKAKPHGASFLENAPLGIVVCGDPQKSDVWVEDCSIAAIFLHLAAESLGLGSCWIQIRKRTHDETKTAGQHVAEVLSIPDHLAVEAIIAVGYPDERKPPHKRETLPEKKVHLNRYGSPFRPA
jgi:nitroreductase